MKTLIFSDTHLSLPFEEKKYNFMRGIIQPADHVIINGDFWDGFFINFSQFLDSPWKNLFPLLKQKNTIYIHGNHDEKDMMDSRTKIFSDLQTDRVDLQIKDKNLIIEHGHRLAFMKNLDNKFIAHRAVSLEKLMVRRIGSRFHKAVGGRLNKKIKRALKKELTEKDIYICGHTHYAEMDQPQRFVNSGIVDYGLGQYLILNNDHIISKEEWYA